MYITLFGPPKSIVSDQGKEFVNNIVKQITDGCGIEHRITSPYHPQANGLTERINSTLVLMLKKHAEDDPHNWDKWLPFVLLAYRTRINTATGFTPFELMFGRQMNTFDDYTTINDDLDDRMIEIKQMIEGVHPKVVERIKERQEKQTMYQDRRHTVEDERLKIGDKVTIKSLKIQGKMQPNFHGIFKLNGFTRTGNYYLENSENQLLKQSYPRSRLKLISSEAEERYANMEKILNSRKINNQFQYLVKWKDLDEKEATWENEENFDSTELIEDYWAENHEPEIIELNLVQITNEQKREYKKDNLKMQIPLLNMLQHIMTIVVLFILIKPNNAFVLEENFKYCEIHDNKAVWDIP